MRTVRAEVDARILEAQAAARRSRATACARCSGRDAPADLDVDDEPFEPLEVKERPVTYYEDLARFDRPEVRLLDYAVKAKHALADLERRKEYPDLVLIAHRARSRARRTVDDPQNAFMSHYFNSTSAGVAAALRMQLDLGPQDGARATASRAEADEIDYRRSRGAGRHPVRGAQGLRRGDRGRRPRRRAATRASKAGKAWISAVAQNFAVGLAEARDLTDALIAFFSMRTRYLQAVVRLQHRRRRRWRARPA